MFFLKIRFFFSLLQSCNDSSRKLNLLRTEWFIKMRVEHKGSRHTGITAPGHFRVGDMTCPLRICPVCYQQKVLTAIVTNFTAIVLAGTIATQWSDYKIMSQLNNLLNLKLVKMQVLNINSAQREAFHSVICLAQFPWPFSASAHPEVRALYEVVNYYSSLGSQLRCPFLCKDCSGNHSLGEEWSPHSPLFHSHCGSSYFSESLTGLEALWREGICLLPLIHSFTTQTVNRYT